MEKPTLRAYAWPNPDGGLSIAWVVPRTIERDPRWIANMYGRHGGGFLPFGSLEDRRARADYEQACKKFSKLFGVACELRWGEAPPAYGKVGGKVLEKHLGSDAQDFRKIHKHAHAIDRLVTELEDRDKPIAKKRASTRARAAGKWLPFSPEVSVELSPVTVPGNYGKKHTFRVWALSEIPGEPLLGRFSPKRPSDKAGWVYLLGPVAGGPWSLQQIHSEELRMSRNPSNFRGLNIGSSIEGRFFLTLAQVQAILAEAEAACFAHEDCRANLALGCACKAKRKKPGRSSGAVVDTSSWDTPRNRETSKKEMAAWLSDPPEHAFVYYSEDMREVRNGMGVKMGDIVSRGKVARKLNGGRSQSIRVRGTNGVVYVGNCNLTGGTYCRLRRAAGQERCVAHDDCRADARLGIACLRASTKASARVGKSRKKG